MCGNKDFMTSAWTLLRDNFMDKLFSMTPEQQQQAAARGKSAAQKAQKKWQSLPQ
jgi:hypothetical protein